MRSFTFLVASALAALTSAQTASTSSLGASGAATQTGIVTSTTAVAATTTAAGPVVQTQSMPPIATAGFNPNNVTSEEKANWCRAERNSCPAVCGGGPSVNQCDDTLLTYACTCYNGTVPDMTRYTQTLPFFICEETRTQCIAAHPDDEAGQGTCESNAQCGTIDPPNIDSTPSSTSTSGSSRPSSTTGGSSGSATTSPTGTNAATIYGADVTTGAFAILLTGFFNFLL